MIEIKGCTALITGASSGLGEEFARQLGREARAVILVARRGDRLEAVKEGLEVRNPELRVQVYVADLTEAGERRALAEFLEGEGLLPDLLINNAGMGDYGEFLDAEWGKTEQMLQLNMMALTHLIHLLLPAMVARGAGGVLNVSSLAGEFPIPDFAAYAASKAYVTSFSEALRLELAEKGVHVSALCPGPVSTEFGAVAGRDSEPTSMPAKEWLRVDAAKAVSEGLEAIGRNKARAFPGFPVFLMATLAGALPKAVLRAIMATRPKSVGEKPPANDH